VKGRDTAERPRRAGRMTVGAELHEYTYERNERKEHREIEMGACLPKHTAPLRRRLRTYGSRRRERREISSSPNLTGSRAGPLLGNVQTDKPVCHAGTSQAT
jgi:hypothetical protein